MSKIICDVCGTSYPETATQCPICGCVRPGDSVSFSANAKEQDLQRNGTYTFVKGGRFSKTNVKKRNNGNAAFSTDDIPDSDNEASATKKKETGLVIAIITLLLAIIAVSIFIALRFFNPALPIDKGNEGSTGQATDGTTESTSASTSLKIPCVGLVISKTSVEFEKTGAALLLNVTLSPVDTTDKLIFTSSDETVATVTQDGKITAVDSGEATITAVCGNYEAECKVICSFESTSTENTEETQAPTVPVEDFELNRKDFTLTKKGETWKLYNGDIPSDQITWTSGDENVATVKDGVVTAVGAGYTTVYGEYGGTKLSCIVRCSDSVGKADGNNTQDAPETEEPVVEGFSLNRDDFSLFYRGDSWVLYDGTVPPGDITWTSDNPAVATVDNGKVVAVGSGNTIIRAKYNGTELTCKVICNF